MKSIQLLALTSAIFAGQAASAQCKGSAPTPVSAHVEPAKNIVETAVAAGDFKTLAAALDAAGLVGALQGEGPFTVFAPTDAAFAKLPEGTVRGLLKPENKGKLTTILTYHVVAGNVGAASVVEMRSAAALNGQKLPIQVTDAGVQVGGAQVVTTDIHCSNGVIHVIDAVMLPNTMNIVETAAEAGTFQTLLAAAKAAGLAEALMGEGPFTILAPTDEAFAALPEGTVESLLKHENLDKLAAILKHHVISGRVYARDAVVAERAETLQGTKLDVGIEGGRLTIAGANVIATDIDATNGVIHVIDRVLLP